MFLILGNEQIAQSRSNAHSGLPGRANVEALVALTHAQAFQVKQERHHIIDRLEAGGVARVDGVHEQERLVLNADLEEEALLDLDDRVGHGGELGALQELEDGAFGHDAHPVRGQHSLA